MALKGFFDAGKCALGLHQGIWAPSAAAPCTQTRTCSRCADVDERTEHTWPDWQPDASTCNQVRACMRCGISEQRLVHQRWDWHRTESNGCLERERCAGCGTWGKGVRAAHAWGAWHYAERHRSAVRECQACGTRASPFPGHNVDDGDEAPSGTGSGTDPAAALRSDFEREVAAGAITVERKAALAAMVASLEQALTATDGDQQQFTGHFKEMLGPVMGMMAEPSRPGGGPRPEPGSRAEALSTVVRAMFHTVGQQVASVNLALVTGEEAGGLAGRLRLARDALHEIVGGDGDIATFEVETLRPLASDIRRFGLRNHLTFAFPVWPGAAVTQEASTVFYSGGGRLRDLVEAACRERSLHCLLPQPQKEPASLRWEQLRRAAVGVFDFTSYEASVPVEKAARVAGVAYELGMALAVGRPAVVVVGDSGGLPFDVDIEPLRLTGGDGDIDEMSAALDEAVYGTQRGTAGSSIAGSLAFLRGLFEEEDKTAALATLEVFKQGVAADAVRAERLCRVALDYLDILVPHLLFPTWPGRYPDPAQPRCFHVTAFGPAWSPVTMAAIEEACPDGMDYIRGDRVLAPDILKAIWDDIGRSTHVVVDLTGLNANVALELGMSHVLGRNVYLISQDDRPEAHFRAIAKYRCHRYTVDLERGTTNLGSIVKKFLTAP